MEKYVKINMKEFGVGVEYTVDINNVSLRDLIGCVICLTRYIEEKTSKSTDE